MTAISNVSQVGGQLLVHYSDKSKQFLVPTGRNVWLPKGQIVSPPPVVVQPDPGGGGTPSTGTVDDYPWPNGTVNTLNPELRYGYRECVDFVCWRLNRDRGVRHSPWKYTWGDLRPPGGNGDAIGWRGDWLILGWSVDIKPVAGCVGWYGSSAGAFGHVNYVQKVNADGSVVLEEYNWGVNKHAYNTRTAARGSAYYPDSFLPAPPG